MNGNFNESYQKSRQIRLAIPNSQQGTLRTKLDWATYTGIWGADKIVKVNIRFPQMLGGASMRRGSQSSNGIIANITFASPQLDKRRRTKRQFLIYKLHGRDLKN